MANTFFYGNEVSEYGQKSGYVDYRTFAKAFNAVLNNDIMSELERKGFYFEMESGFVDNSEKIEKLESQIEELEEFEEENESEIEALRNEIEELEEEQDSIREIFQYYIIDDNGVKLCKDAGEIVFYCSELDIYIWGVTHYGTAWDYVLTNIEL